ncbi:hypothetical protein [Streptomyces sindenensis]|nr:hypothetical protein [Streptomyces sindenensis]
MRNCSGDKDLAEDITREATRYPQDRIGVIVNTKRLASEVFSMVITSRFR